MYENNDETLKRDRLLLDLMIHVYDEELARNELVDNKNCQMIVLTGVMLTLQATFFTELLVNRILLNCLIGYDIKVILSVIMLVSMVLYMFRIIL